MSYEVTQDIIKMSVTSGQDGSVKLLAIPAERIKNSGMY
jgi:hypothetical protein